ASRGRDRETFENPSRRRRAGVMARALLLAACPPQRICGGPMIRPCALVGTAALVGLLAAPAQAVPITEQTLIATGGDVVVTFVSNGAGFTSELFLDGSFGDSFGAIFNNA